MEQQIQVQQVDDLPATQAKGPMHLVFGLLVLAVATMATVLAIVLIIPDENDYAKATLLKHARLESLASPKVVLVGGSNLAYGIESDVLERETGLPAVNMGMNGYFGSRYMLSEVKPSLKSGDVVVLAFEWDNYGKSIDGTGKDLFVIARTNPSALAYFTPEQASLAAMAVPYIAHVKLLRVINQLVDGGFAEVGVSMDQEQSQEFSLMNDVESLRHFDPEGDLNGHVGVVWDGDYEQGLDIAGNGLNLDLIALIKSFAHEMSERGVTVIVSYTPTMRSYYETQSGPINEAHHLLTSGPDAVYTPRSPDAFVFDKSHFFDTVYHLKATFRDGRTQMVAEDINTALARPMTGSRDIQRDTHD